MHRTMKTHYIQKSSIILGFLCGAAIGPNNLIYGPPANSVLFQVMDRGYVARAMHSPDGHLLLIGPMFVTCWNRSEPWPWPDGGSDIADAVALWRLLHACWRQPPRLPSSSGWSATLLASLPLLLCRPTPLPRPGFHYPLLPVHHYAAWSFRH